MSLPNLADQPDEPEWQIYDAILMELSDPHPNLSYEQEAALKGRLLQVIEVNTGEHDPAELMRRFREAMDGV